MDRGTIKEYIKMIEIMLMYAMRVMAYEWQTHREKQRI